jgi:hypothetical protein
MLRLTGKASKIDIREGSKDGRPWQIVTIKVLTEDVDVVEVTLGRNCSTPDRGAQVDLAVESRLRPAQGPYPAQADLVAVCTWAEASGELPADPGDVDATKPAARKTPAGR